MTAHTLNHFMSCAEGRVEVLKGIFGQRSDDTDASAVLVHNLVGVNCVALWSRFLERSGDLSHELFDSLNTFLLVQFSEGHGGDWSLIHIVPVLLGI